MILMHDCQIQDSYCSHILSFLDWSLTFTRATCWWSPIPPSWAINRPCVPLKRQRFFAWQYCLSILEGFEMHLIHLHQIIRYSSGMEGVEDATQSYYDQVTCHSWSNSNSQLSHRTNAVIASWLAGSLRLSNRSFASHWRSWWNWLTRACLSQLTSHAICPTLMPVSKLPVSFVVNYEVWWFSCDASQTHWT